MAILQLKVSVLQTRKHSHFKALEGKGYAFVSAQVEMVPQNYIALSGEGDLKNMAKLIEMLEDNDDVQNVWHNWENMD